jgi:hypothetical protein
MGDQRFPPLDHGAVASGYFYCLFSKKSVCLFYKMVFIKKTCMFSSRRLFKVVGF